MLIDTHCHLDFEAFDHDRSEVLARAAAAGVGRIIAPALDLDNVGQVVALAEKHASVYAAVGVHPNSAAAWQDAWLAELRAAAAHPKVIAIGEIGLDYHRDRALPAVQRRAFEAQLALAAELGLPVIVHNRQADEDVLGLLAASQLPGRSRAGVLHSFSSNSEVAGRGLALGFLLGFSGPLTYKSAEALRQVAAEAPAERILIETDAPFLAPQSRRGQRNEPANVRFVADKLAALRGLTTDQAAGLATANALRLFWPQEETDGAGPSVGSVHGQPIRR
ncbi:MAG: TatD family hydrolase [Candidatus Promineifilaceae bacterium]